MRGRAVDFDKKMILALADALRTPVLQLHVGLQSSNNPKVLSVISEATLKDIDAFMQSVMTMPTQLALEPLSLGAVLEEVSQHTKDFAALNNADITLDNRSAHQLVMGHAPSLKLGMELMTRALCEMSGDEGRSTVQLRADTRHGYPRAGVYRKDIALRAEDINLARKLIGGAQVTASQFSQLGALRLGIASELLKPLSIRVRCVKSNGMSGVGFQLFPSTQLGMF